MVWRPGFLSAGHSPASSAATAFRVHCRWLLVCWLLFAPGLAAAEVLHGTVIHVADGDTVTVLDSGHVRHKVRLSGIDAPEKAQPFGTRSRQHLTALLQGKNVIVVWNKHDRYGRIIGKVLTGTCAIPSCIDVLDAGLNQVRAGLAWHYKQYQRDQEPGDRERYANAEHAARMSRAGLWLDTSPVPPWKFRRRAHTALPMPAGSGTGS